MDQENNLLIRVSRRAMACEFEVCFPADTCENGTDFALESLDLVEDLEQRLSFFQPASGVNRINALAAESPVEVAPDLFNLLRLALQLHDETEGAYDITSTPLWEAWGFARRAGEIPSDAQLAAAKACVGSHLIELDPASNTVRFRKPGVRINLASIGKGYALDVSGERLRELGMADFLLHGGQSSVLAHGSPRSAGVQSRSVGVSPALANAGGTPALRGMPPVLHSRPRPWDVGLADPRRPGHRLAVVRLHDRALGTSGGQFQSFRHQGRRYGHILDPRSGLPADGVLSTTVVAATAAMADALSTAFYVMGPERSLAYCKTHPTIGMVMFCRAPRGDEVQVQIAGLDDNDMELMVADG
jgi:thiamine biosynthesis lipoprotein